MNKLIKLNKLKTMMVMIIMVIVILMAMQVIMIAGKRKCGAIQQKKFNIWCKPKIAKKYS